MGVAPGIELSNVNAMWNEPAWVNLYGGLLASQVLLSDTRTSLQGLAMTRCTTLSWYAV